MDKGKWEAVERGTVYTVEHRSGDLGRFTGIICSDGYGNPIEFNDRETAQACADDLNARIKFVGN